MVLNYIFSDRIRLFTYNFPALLQFEIFDPAFGLFVIDEICGHISTYISSQLNLNVKFHICSIQTQMEDPLISQRADLKYFEE